MLVYTLHELAKRGSRQPSAELIFEFRRRIVTEMREWEDRGELAEYLGLKPAAAEIDDKYRQALLDEKPT